VAKSGRRRDRGPTRDLHHEIIKVGFGIAKDIVVNTAPFDTGNDMFNDDTDSGNELREQSKL
jgi:hypothetical protein